MSIQVRNIRFVYNEGLPDEAVALDDVSFDLFDGEIAGVIGHTGSGKSTMLQQLNGLLRPQEGTIVVDGKEITSPTAVLRDVRRSVGLVFQYPEYQLFEETVEKDVAFGPGNTGVPEDEIEDRVRRSLTLVGLDFDDIRSRSPFDLSGGQKRRAAIAGVLAMEPHVLVLDEPTAGLDPEAHREIIDMIRRIHEERNGMIILVSHNMMDIASLSDRVIVMDRGRVVTEDTPANVFANRGLLKGIGLDVPPVTAFMHSLKMRGIDISTAALTYDEAAAAILSRFGVSPDQNRAGGSEESRTAGGGSEKRPAEERPAEEDVAGSGSCDERGGEGPC